MVDGRQFDVSFLELFKVLCWFLGCFVVSTLHQIFDDQTIAEYQCVIDETIVYFGANPSIFQCHVMSEVRG